MSTYNKIVRLPDGTVVGTRIPFGERWNGYRRIRLEGFQFGWEKVVRQGSLRTKVTLKILEGRVDCIFLERAG